jgi:PEP-CTERM motif-containing protein
VEKDSKKIMRYLRPVVIAILVCASSVAMRAQDIKVSFDPPSTPVFIDPNDVFQPITSVNQPVTFAWGACDAADNPYAPSEINGDTACANFANLTGQAISQLTFTFLASTSIVGGDTVSCASLDPDLSTPSCPANPPNGFADGTPVSVTFSGGTPIPPSLSKTDLSVFFLAETGVSAADINSLSWSADVPEPSSLGMLAAGMGLLGLCVGLVKR